MDNGRTSSGVCSKVPYKTAAKAERAMRGALRRKGTKRQHLKTNQGRGVGAKLNTFKCVQCGSFHWGHAIQGRNTVKKRYRREK